MVCFKDCSSGNSVVLNELLGSGVNVPINASWLKYIQARLCCNDVQGHIQT